MPISPCRNVAGLLLGLVVTACPAIAFAAAIKMPAITYNAPPLTAVTRVFTMPEIGFTSVAEHIVEMPAIRFAPAATRVFTMPEIGFAPVAEHVFKMPAIDFAPAATPVFTMPEISVAPSVESVFMMPQIRFSATALPMRRP